ncbi:heptaprenyl diphosphate synthase [Marinitoga hydrogenitolerans DSM 16785]|uniref:Heptaprenyl diphosphate synthase n=1 Tax=Marinitoga hydrogenitolerans (strain DSM 16785 / JCM 12826 / AT1271) TaxID=1122195 RepID=A0A1M4VRJ2_MARH1|nr:Gx transporter family protein [Marinitoga hydrogenitolerans]SHE71480.1 heptaprenyl diphosphate synthase [Marinitoga hydrogenitolerans DSM 16785]
MVKNNIPRLAILTALSSAVYYLETLVPFPIPLPGARWGFSNFAILYSLNSDENLINGIYIALFKSVLGALLAGKLFSPTFLMGLSGSLIATFTMYIVIKTKKFGIIGISEVGAIFNNLTQVTIGWLFIVKSIGIFWYLPQMILFGTFSALANAFVVKSTFRSVNR